MGSSFIAFITSRLTIMQLVTWGNVQIFNLISKIDRKTVLLPSLLLPACWTLKSATTKFMVSSFWLWNTLIIHYDFLSAWRVWLFPRSSIRKCRPSIQHAGHWEEQSQAYVLHYCWPRWTFLCGLFCCITGDGMRIGSQTDIVHTIIFMITSRKAACAILYSKINLDFQLSVHVTPVTEVSIWFLFLQRRYVQFVVDCFMQALEPGPLCAHW